MNVRHAFNSRAYVLCALYVCAAPTRRTYSAAVLYYSASLPSLLDISELCSFGLLNEICLLWILDHTIKAFMGLFTLPQLLRSIGTTSTNANNAALSVCYCARSRKRPFPPALCSVVSFSFVLLTLRDKCSRGTCMHQFMRLRVRVTVRKHVWSWLRYVCIHRLLDTICTENSDPLIFNCVAFTMYTDVRVLAFLLDTVVLTIACVFVQRDAAQRTPHIRVLSENSLKRGGRRMTMPTFERRGRYCAACHICGDARVGSTA